MQSQNRLKETYPALPGARAARRSWQRSQVRRLLILGDLVLVNLAAFAALWLGVQRSAWWLAVASWDAFLAWFIFLSALWFVMAQVLDLYDLRIAGLPRRAIRATLMAVLGTLAVYVVIYFIAAPQTLPRHLIVFFAGFAAVGLTLWRGGFALAVGAGPLARRVVMVGGGESARVSADALREHAPNYYCIVAQFDPSIAPDAARQIPPTNLDEVHVSAAADLDDEWLALLVAWREQGVQVVNMAAVYEELTGRVPVEHVGKTWSVLLPLEQDATRGVNGFVKRTCDVLFSALALLVLAPILPLLALAVRLDSRGVILVRQTRVGQNGRIFVLYKFRSMIADAEKPGVPQWAERDDPRVTRVGKFLRRFKLDEVPQFWNVLRGEMALVGPRPERPEIVENLQREIPFYRLRHVVRPGVTGWAAIRFPYGRSVNDALVKLQYDLYYIKHQSLSLDALILFKTLGAVLAPPQAE
jgi:exopolysaccharide biosynthesis polyprenyl glycosylphosphotransferase